jgi:hypothetical protein
MSTQVKEFTRENEEHRKLAAEILDAIKGIKYGGVEITVHDSRVVQIDRRERFRFPTSERAQA